MKRRGQSLIEILVAVAIGGLIVGSAAVAVTVALRVNSQSKSVRTGSLLLQEMMDNTRSIAEGNWHTLYNLAKGSTTSYYVDSSLVFSTGTRTATVDGTVYTLHFSVENVQRSSLGGPIVASGTDDPSTQKITGYIAWPNGSTLSAVEYLTRHNNRVQTITDWSDPTTYSSQSGLDLSTPGQATLQ